MEGRQKESTTPKKNKEKDYVIPDSSTDNATRKINSRRPVLRNRSKVDYASLADPK